MRMSFMVRFFNDGEIALVLALWSLSKLYKFDIISHFSFTKKTRRKEGKFLEKLE